MSLHGSFIIDDLFSFDVSWGVRCFTSCAKYCHNETLNGLVSTPFIGYMYIEVISEYRSLARLYHSSL